MLAYDVARASGVDQSVVGRFLRGERDVRFRTAVKIGAAIGLTLAPISGGKAAAKGGRK
jgi:hypothetical protein